MGGRREREGSGDRLWPPWPRGCGSATAELRGVGLWGRRSPPPQRQRRPSPTRAASPTCSGSSSTILSMPSSTRRSSGSTPTRTCSTCTPSSPLAWDVHHWFPCPIKNNLLTCSSCFGGVCSVFWAEIRRREDDSQQPADHAVQLQASRKKHNKLEFLVPWWDLQLSISVNQFLSIFTAKNTDFKNRAFVVLFTNGANEELSSLRAVEAHAFLHHFADMKKKLGLAPAAVVSARGSDSFVLKSVDANRPVRSNYPLIAAKKFSGEKDENLAAHSHGGNSMTKENNNPDVDGYISNPYLSIAMARDSLRQREEAKKKQVEFTELENEARRCNRIMRRRG